MTTNSYRPELDGLRALAVVAVIVNHFHAAALPSGFLGVDLFFVLSGYVVSGSMAARPAEGWGSFLAGFYVRRIRRIMPALLVCITLSSLIGALFIQYPEPSLSAGLLAIFGASNVHFYLHASDYFGEDAAHNLFTHTWSLGVEEQFYLLFPALFLASIALRRRLPHATVIMVAALTAASLGLWFRLYSTAPSFTYFMLPTRFWELGLGCLLFFLTQGRTAGGRWAPLVASAALGVMLALFFASRWDAMYTTPAICAAAAVLIWTARPDTFPGLLLASRPAVAIGLLSYSLYLWHFPVLVISRFTIGISAYTVAFQVASMLALAWVSYRFVEQPCRYGAVRLRPEPVFAAAVVAMSLSAGAVLKLDHRPNVLFSADQPRFVLARPEFTPAMKFAECRKVGDFDLATFPPPCFHATGSDRTLWMVGDSTTWALKGLASEVVKSTGWNFIMFADDSAFPSAELSAVNSAGDEFREPYRRFHAAAFAYVREHVKPGDVVLITANLGDLFCLRGELYCRNLRAADSLMWRDQDGRELTVDDGMRHFLDEMHRLGARLTERGATLALSAPLPRWTREHRIMCERQWYRPRWENSRCLQPSYADQVAARARIMQALRAAQRPGGFLVFDPFPTMCRGDQCAFSDERTNTNLWIDETHLSQAGGAKLAPDFLAFLAANAAPEGPKAKNPGPKPGVNGGAHATLETTAISRCWIPSGTRTWAGSPLCRTRRR